MMPVITRAPRSVYESVTVSGWAHITVAEKVPAPADGCSVSCTSIAWLPEPTLDGVEARGVGVGWGVRDAVVDAVAVAVAVAVADARRAGVGRGATVDGGYVGMPGEEVRSGVLAVLVTGSTAASVEGERNAEYPVRVAVTTSTQTTATSSGTHVHGGTRRRRPDRCRPN
jgi:hypothetical protein